MTRDRLYLYDTTLRDGAQTQGVDFSPADKTLIAEMLDQLGLDYIEGGWPGANPTDTAFFDAPPALKTARFTAFGMTKRPGRSLDNDPGFGAVLNAQAEAGCLVGKSWDFQVTTALGVTLEENLEAITHSLATFRDAGKEALFDAEHFFDGYKANPDYALKCLDAACAGGAAWIVLCDTNGGVLPHEVDQIVREVDMRGLSAQIGVHFHNDTDHAVANSLAAVTAGARMIQGTLNGLGERCGNANLTTLIPTLLLKEPFRAQFDIAVPEEGLKALTKISRRLDEILNRAPNPYAPYVGESAFAHKGGLHASAMRKDSRTYEHVSPDTVGNQRKILVSGQSGRANVLTLLEQIGLSVDPEDSKVARLLETVKVRESAGYNYDMAEASFELLARQHLDTVPDYFFVERFRASAERRYNANGELVSIAEATVKILVGGEEILSAAEGNGPVNALDAALRRDLGRYSAHLEDLHLEDYKVRILTTGTTAITRVLIESRNGAGDRWFTVGVSENIVDASFQALTDSIRYKLFKDGAEG